MSRECPWHVHISSMALHDDDGLLNVNMNANADAAVIVGSLGCAFPAANGPSPHELMNFPPRPHSTQHHHHHYHRRHHRRHPSNFNRAQTSFIQMTHQQNENQRRQLPTVVYQQQQKQSPPPPPSSFALSPSTLKSAGADGGEHFETIEDNEVKRQLSSDSSSSNHHHRQQSAGGEPRRLIVGEMSSGALHDSGQTAAMLFGPFYRLSKPFFGPVIPGQYRRQPAKTVLFFLILLLLIGRAIFYMSQLGKSLNLSLDWARASLQMSITLNALGALGWMYKNGAFPRQFVGSLLTAIGQNQPKSSTGSLIGAGIVSIFILYTSAIWAILRLLQMHIHDDVKSVMVYAADGFNNGFLSSNSSSNAPVRIDAIFLISVACLDSFLAVLSGFLGALVLGIFHLSFRCVLAEWDAFKREHVDENSESGRIAQPDVFTGISNSASALLRFAHFTSNKFDQLGTGMFMTAIFCNISATFIGGVVSLNESNNGGNGSVQWPLYNVFDKMNNINWSILSIMLLVITLKGPYDVHSMIREIKEQLLLDDRIWNANDQNLPSMAKNLIRRLEGIRIHRIGTLLFQLVFVAQMVLIWLLISGSTCSSSSPKHM